MQIINLRNQKINCNCKKSETLYQRYGFKIYIISILCHMHYRFFFMYIALYGNFFLINHKIKKTKKIYVLSTIFYQIFNKTINVSINNIFSK